MKDFHTKKVLIGVCFLFARDLHLQGILRSCCYYCIRSHLNLRLQNVIKERKKALKILFLSGNLFYMLSFSVYILSF